MRETHATARSSKARPKASSSLECAFKRWLLFPGVSDFRYAYCVTPRLRAICTCVRLLLLRAQWWHPLELDVLSPPPQAT